MNFTVITNSRKRPQLLRNAIGSLLDNAECPEKIEVLVRIDDDDDDTKETIKQYPANVTFFEGERRTNLAINLNELAAKAKGRFILIFNDDALMTTPHWDVNCLQAVFVFKSVLKIKDDIIFVKLQDTSVDKPNFSINYSSFSVLSREAVQALGYIVNESFVTLGGDSHIYRIFDKLARIVDCSDVLIDHIGHNTLEKVMNPDNVAAEYRRNSARNPADPFTLDIVADVKKLKGQLKYHAD